MSAAAVVHDWSEKLAKGAEGERRVISWFREQGAWVVDLRDDPFWQQRDIDLLVDGESVEIKTDHRAKDKLFVEFQALAKSEATWWYYFAPTIGKLFRLDRQALAEYIADNAGRFWVFTISSGRGNQRWRVQGVAPRISELLAACDGEEWDLEQSE